MENVYAMHGFDIEIDGEIYSIERDICHVHPEVVHAALGTSCESDLQICLDALNESMWFDGGKYLGRDENGLGLRGL